MTTELHSIKMNIDQYLLLKNADQHENYLMASTPEVNIYQIGALWKALSIYLNSNCVTQRWPDIGTVPPQVQNARNILTDKHVGTLYFMYELLRATVFNNLLNVLPIGSPTDYQYHAGICKGDCGYGTNRVVAILGNTLILSYPKLEDIRKYPKSSLVDVWQAFKSKTLAQNLGTGINYNFKGKNCDKEPYGPIYSPVRRPDEFVPPDNMFSESINIGLILPSNAC